MGTDFQKMAQFLRFSGLSDREIGRRLGTDGQTVVRIANGQQPRYDVGESLKAVFWERYEVYSRAMDEFTDWVAKQER